MNHLDNWEKGLQSRLANHRTPPPATGWEKLEEALNATPVARNDDARQHANNAGKPANNVDKRANNDGKPVKRRPVYLRPAFVSTVLTAAACVAVAFLLIPSAEVTDGVVTQMAQTTGQKDGNMAKPVQNEKVVAKTEPQRAEKAVIDRIKEVRKAGKDLARAGKTAMPIVDELPVLRAVKRANAVARPAAVDSAENERQGEAENASASRYFSDNGTAVTRTRRFQSAPANFKRVGDISKKQANHTPLLALHASAAPSDRKGNEGYYAGSAALGGSGELWAEKAGSNDMAMVYAQNFNRQVNTHVKHRTPFVLGLSVSVPLTNRWAFTTGLTYTRLSTEIESGSEESYFVTSQRLHYVGVPLQASYTLFRSRPLNVYVTAGGEIEKCVKGEQNTVFNVDETYRSSAGNRTDLGKGLWQLSFNASAGFQFNITKNMGLYFEPGVAYYVSDGSSFPSIRHDKPWQFNMQGGLRFSISPK